MATWIVTFATVMALTIAVLFAASPLAARTAAKAPDPLVTAASTATQPPAGEPALTETPAPSASATVAADPTQAPITRPASVTGRLAIDANRNGTLDDGDESLSVATGVNLVYWDRVPDLTFPLPEQTGEPISSPTPWPVFDVSVLTNKDGTYELTNLPEGSYTLRIFWAGGFSLGATRQSPDLWRAIFSVDAEGKVTPPNAVPEFWPESFKQERIELDPDHVWLGPPPEVLLVLPKDAGVVPYPVDAGGSEPAVGSLDVGQAFRRELPDAGPGREVDGRSLLPALGIALASVAALVYAGRLIGRPNR